MKIKVIEYIREYDNLYCGSLRFDYYVSKQAEKGVPKEFIYEKISESFEYHLYEGLYDKYREIWIKLSDYILDLEHYRIRNIDPTEKLIQIRKILSDNRPDDFRENIELEIVDDTKNKSSDIYKESEKDS